MQGACVALEGVTPLEHPRHVERGDALDMWLKTQRPLTGSRATEEPWHHEAMTTCCRV